MDEHAQALEPWMTGPIICMIAGSIFLAASTFTFILVAESGQAAGLLAVLLALAIPSIPIGVMLFPTGLVNTTKKPSLRWLRITVSILCGILLGLAVLWFLLILELLILGF